MNDKEKIYYARGTEELRMKNIRAHKLVQDFNHSAIEDFTKRAEIIKDLFGSVGVNLSIEHNFHCDLGYNIHVGDHFYAGYNCTILDMEEFRIGHNCMIGSNVGIYTAGSVVTKDVPANTIVAGNPAKTIKKFNLQTSRMRKPTSSEVG